MNKLNNMSVLRESCPVNINIKHLIFVDHLVESLIQLATDNIDLHLLSDDLILQVINPEMELANVHLGVLGP